MRKRLHIILFLVVSLIMVFAITVFAQGFKLNSIIDLIREDKSVYIETLEEETKDYIKEAGRTESMNVYEDISAYTIYYPVFENAQMNEDIKEIINGAISEFNDKLSQYSKFTPSRGVLYINYESFNYPEDIVSVIFDIKYTPPFEETAETYLLNYVFNTKTNETMTSETTFKNTDIITEGIRDYFETRYPKESFIYEDFSNIPKDKLVSNFVFKKDNAVFYINKKDILKEGNGYVSVSFDYNSIESCFNEKNESTKPFIKRRTLDPNLPTIALTFDDGPHRVNTNRLLDILSENNAKATFFVLGSRAIYEPDILMRMVNEGHQIGNHTYSHKSLSTLTINEIDQEVSKTNDFVKSVTGKDVELIRPPYGAVNQTVISNTDEPLILWSIDTLDWKSKNKDKIREEVLTKVKDGDIILMHDIYKSTIDACETIIPELIEQGYQLVTVDELFELKGIDLNANNKYYSAKTK